MAALHRASREVNWMLTPEGLLSWFQRLSAPEPTRTTITHVRSFGPSRRVGSGRSNVSGLYPSKKMGVTIHFESHWVELAGIYALEHDAAVFEYFDQPPPIKLQYESAPSRVLLRLAISGFSEQVFPDVER